MTSNRIPIIGQHEDTETLSAVRNQVERLFERSRQHPYSRMVMHDKATVLILAETPDLAMLLADHVKNIDIQTSNLLVAGNKQTAHAEGEVKQ